MVTMLVRSGPTRRPDDLAATREERRFAARRAEVVDRLVAAGMARMLAEGWIAAWDQSTAGLVDFRATPEFWELGYRYALEEHRRGYRPPESLRLIG